ncbi:MAG: Holliday junction branch migration DNA helicase RuvB [Phycisphaerae bacterium]|nr:Holliday junction branch migration DNA helicase RuvB [Phycisphaerae bacterium]
MATDRVIAPTPPDPATPDGLREQSMGRALRPERIGEYIGQPDLLERLRIAIGASKGRGEPLEHLLLHGPPGLGKTTLAHVIAAEMEARVYVTSGPALAKGTDLVGALTRLELGDVLFIDEIHRLPAPVEEFIYPAMEDFKIDVSVDTGLNARTVQIKCKPFTLIGATTRAGMLSAPLRSRFGISHHLRYYDEAELLEILERSARLLSLDAGKASTAALQAIAKRSRGTPRIANRLLRRVRDYADVRADGRLTDALVADALSLEGVDELGLDELDRAYLRAIGETYEGGPVGLETIAATMNQDAGTLEDMVEPFLLQIAFLARTRRGRVLTRAGAAHVGVRLPENAPEADDALFD